MRKRPYVGQLTVLVAGLITGTSETANVAFRLSAELTWSLFSTLAVLSTKYSSLLA
jgi:hypothetical protein